MACRKNSRRTQKAHWADVIGAVQPVHLDTSHKSGCWGGLAVSGRRIGYAKSISIREKDVDESFCGWRKIVMCDLAMEMGRSARKVEV